MPTIITHQAEIYYESHGSGPGMVFVHGVGGNSLSWWQQVPYFQNDHQVIVIDQRGFGRSTDPKQLGRAEFVNDLAAVLDALQIEKAALVGQSLGGISCAGLTGKMPERVSTLVMADTLLGVLSPDDVEEDLNRRRAKYLDAPTIERAMTPQTVAARPDLVYLFQHITAMNATNRHTLKGEFEKVPLDHLAATGVPVLFIVGAEDRLYPPACIKPVHQAVANSEYLEIQNAGHSAYFEQSDKFNIAVAEFVARHSGE